MIGQQTHQLIKRLRFYLNICEWVMQVYRIGEEVKLHRLNWTISLKLYRVQKRSDWTNGMWFNSFSGFRREL